MSYASMSARKIASRQKGSSSFERRKYPLARKRTMSGANTDANENIARQDDPIGSCKVTCSALNVRSGAGSGYERIGGLTGGKSVQVYAVEGDWLKIAYGSGFGWIARKYTDFKEKPLFDVTITGDVNVRTGPGKENQGLGVLYPGEQYSVYEEKDGWYRIEYKGQVGWFHGSYCTVNGENPGPGGNDNDKVVAVGKKAEQVARNLMQQSKTEGWVYSQSKREENGYYDCSSFCCRVWKAAGYDFNWANSGSMGKKCDDASASFSANTKAIAGDLLFFALKATDNYKGISHVAIATDNQNEMIDPGTKSISISNPNGSYYGGKLVMIGRPGMMIK
ncbi:MAG: SH3 domain-containing protein [Proteobacteria bacterium]|nr:SH3 domain-containing protein [Pseudomonadota bacterium]